MPESLGSLIREVADLKAAVGRHSDEVEHLSEALTVMNDIQVKQQAVERKVNQVEQTAVTRTELDPKQTRTDLHNARTRVLLSLVLVGLILITLVVAVVTFVRFRNEVHSFRGSTYDLCLARSAQAEGVRAYLDRAEKQALARAETEAERQRVRAGLGQLRRAFPAVDCNQIK